MGLVGFLILIIIAGIYFDDKWGTTLTTGGTKILVGIVITVVFVAINPILGIIVGILYFRGLDE